MHRRYCDEPFGLHLAQAIQRVAKPHAGIDQHADRPDFENRINQRNEIDPERHKQGQPRARLNAEID